MISCALSDHVWWCNIKCFQSYPKNYILKLMHANSWHHKLSHLHLSFWIWKVWKGREKNYKHLDISRPKRAFPMKSKTFLIFFFHSNPQSQQQTQATYIQEKEIKMSNYLSNVEDTIGKTIASSQISQNKIHFLHWKYFA